MSNDSLDITRTDLGDTNTQNNTSSQVDEEQKSIDVDDDCSDIKPSKSIQD